MTCCHEYETDEFNRAGPVMIGVSVSTTTDCAAGSPASPRYDPAHNTATLPAPHHSANRSRSVRTALLPASHSHLNRRTTRWYDLYIITLASVHY